MLHSTRGLYYRFAPVFVLIGAALALPSCVGTASEEGCSSNADCAAGQVCREQSCLDVCLRDDQCPKGNQVCDAGACVTRQDAQCTTAGDCITPAPCETADAACVGGACTYPAKPCTTPPQGECVGGNSTYRAYGDAGTCGSASGQCVYGSIDLSCPDCSTNCLGRCDTVVCDDLNGGCRTTGTCLPGMPPTCVYTDAPDGGSCDDGDPCSTADNCAAGVCVSTPISNGSPCEGAPGYCGNGICNECLTDQHCDDASPCTTDTCFLGTCDRQPLSGPSCDDGNLCTQTDTCEAGACVGGNPVVCSAGRCLDAGQCDPMTGVCSTPWQPPGAFCNDNNACTYDDACDGAGGCSGTSITCTTTTCSLQSCNGTSSCSVSNLSNLTACDDGDPCSYSDHCDGTGACAGTPYSCAADTVCQNHYCDGAGGCGMVGFTGQACVCGYTNGTCQAAGYCLYYWLDSCCDTCCNQFGGGCYACRCAGCWKPGSCSP